MGKKFKDIKIGDTVYVVSVYVNFNVRGDNSENELMYKVEGRYPLLARYDSSGPSTFFVNKTMNANERIRRLLLSTEKVESENGWIPQSASITTIDIGETDKENDFVINRFCGGHIKVYSTSMETLKNVFDEVIDAIMKSENIKSNRKMSSLMELKARKL